MKYKIIIFILAVLVVKCHSANDGKCIINDEDINWGSNIYTHDQITDTEGLNKVFEFEGTLTINSVENSTYRNFIDVTVDENNKQLIFKTNSGFDNFDESVPKQLQTTVSIVVIVKLQCEAGLSTLRFIVPVKDTNNHAPNFKKKSYSYNMPMPLVPRIDLTSFGDELTARDEDFSNQNVKFTIDPPGPFELATISDSTSKDYRAVLKVTAFTWLSEDTTYTITATDSGTPPLTSSTTLTIKLDESNILPDVPKFSKTSYRFNYTVDDDGNPTLTASTDDLIEITTTDPEAITVELEANDYFTASFNSSTKQVTIASTSKLIDITSEHVMVLQLTVTLNNNKDDSSQAIILINIPNENVVNVPVFTEPYYTATYLTDTSPNTIELVDGKEIAVKQNAANVDIKLTGELADYFTISKTGDQWQLSIEDDLESETLKKGEDILLTLTATVTGEGADVDPGYATLIVKLPEIIPIVFTEPYYTATYSTDTTPNTVDLDDGQEIAFKQNAANVEITLTGESADYFTISKTGDQWQLSVENDIDSEILKKGGDIVLTLTATVTGEGVDVDPGYATLIVKLPEITPIEVPRFSNTHYMATYVVNDDGQDSVEVDEPIAASSTGSKSVTVDFKNKSDNFEIVQSTDSWTVSVKVNLPEDDLQAGGEIVLDLQGIATGKGAEDVKPGYATLIIKLPDVVVIEVPKFSKTYYSATYIINEGDALDTVELTNQIEIVSPKDQTIDVTFQENTDEYFKISKNSETGNIEVSVIKDLADDILDAQQDYILTLKATIEGVEVDSGFATLVIILPKPEPVVIPKFSEAYYTATYVPGVDKPTVEITNGPIAIVSRENQTVAVSLEKNSDNFNLVQKSDGSYDIEVTSDLDESTLISEVDIILTLQATIDGTTETGYSTLIIKLPKKTSAAGFSSSFYDATYVINGDEHTVEITGTITLTGDNVAETTVALIGDYADHFTLSTDEPYTITVNDPLDDTILYVQSEVIVTLEASLKETNSVKTHATVIIKLPAVPTAPKFLNKYYTAKYAVEDDDATVKLEGDQTIKTDAKDPTSAKVQISADDTYTNNFKLSYDESSKSYELELSTALDSTIVDKESEIYVTLEATVDHAIDSNYATLIIKMPEDVVNVVPKFSSAFYTATYTKVEGDKDTVTIPSKTPITITSDYSADTDVTVVGTYAANFRAVKDNDVWQIEVDTNLDDNILKEVDDIQVLLEASLSGTSETSRSVLILNLPGRAPNPIPQFSETYYTAEYDNTNPKEPSVAYTSEPIAITSTNEELVTVTIDSDYQEFFTLTRDATNKQWKLETKDPLSQDILDKNTEIAIKLTAVLEDSAGDGSATLLVRLPEKKPVIVTFNQTSYVATYTVDESGTDTLSGPDISISDGTATIIITGDYASNFNINCATDGKCTLEVETDLSDDVLQTKLDTVIVLSATLEDVVEPGTATVLINLPKKSLRATPIFSKTYYTVSYTAKDSLSGDTVVNVTSAYTDISLKVKSDEYEANFDVLPNSDIDNEWTVVIKDPLKDEILDTKTEIVIELVASLDNSISDGTATVVVRLPEKRAIPTFTRTYYSAQYTSDSTDGPSIDMVGDEIAITGDFESEVKVEKSGTYAKYFDLTHDTTNHQWKLTVTTALEDNILNDNTEIVIELVSTLKKSVGDGTAIVVINLPKKRPIPKFTRTYYTAQYKTDSPAGHSINITGDKIAVKSDFESMVEVKISDTYDDYFQLNHDIDNQQWSLSIKKDLDEGILKDNTEIVIELVSTLDKSLGDGTATILVKLPDNEGTRVIKFDDPYYTVNYTITPDGTDNVEANKDIKLNIGDADVSIVSTDYSTNFGLKCDAGICQLIVLENLDTDVLVSTSEILIVLRATTADSAADGTATIIIRLPSLEDKIPKFTRTVYTATYYIDDSEKGTLALNDSIEINGYDPDKITITISGDDGDNFNAVVEDGQWQIVVTNNLPSEVLKVKATVFLTLTAEVKDDPTIAKSESKLIIELPKATTASSINFDQNVYTADYSKDGNEITFNSEIIVIGETADVTINLNGSYADNFDSTYDDGKVTITLKEELPIQALESGGAISVVITATKGTDTALATLVVNLPPVKVSNSSINFEKNVYMADYSEDNKITIDSDIIIIGNTEQVTVTLSGEYAENFEPTYDNGKVTVTLNEELPTETLGSGGAISVDIKAITGTDTASATLVVKLPLVKVSNSSINFKENVYMASYSTDNNNITIDNEIMIIGDTDEVTVTLSGDYALYFDVTYNEGDVTVTLTNNLPSKSVDDGGVITVDIKASKGTNTASATLVIKLPAKATEEDDDDSSDNTGLIAAVAVLAVLLVAAIVGSVIFYYIKFRRGGSYSDDVPYTQSITFKPPTRRPTTGIVYKLQNEETGASSSLEKVPEKVPEKRKSVVFDTENIDELPIEKTEEDPELDADESDSKKDTEIENCSEL